MADDVLCARITPDGRLLALALLDSTIQASTYGQCSMCQAASVASLHANFHLHTCEN